MASDLAARAKRALNYRDFKQTLLLMYVCMATKPSVGCMVESFQDATGNGGMLQIGMGDNGLQHARSDEGEPQPRSVCQWSTTVRVPANKAIFISADNFNIPKTTTDENCDVGWLDILDGSVTPAVLHYRACGSTFHPIYRQWSAVVIRFVQSGAANQKEGSTVPSSRLQLQWRIVNWPPASRLSAEPSGGCGVSEFSCRLSRRCIPLSDTCNSVPDCSAPGAMHDFSDETEMCMETAYLQSEYSPKSESSGRSSEIWDMLATREIYIPLIVISAMCLAASVAALMFWRSAIFGHSGFRSQYARLSSISSALRQNLKNKSVFAEQKSSDIHFLSQISGQRPPNTKTTTASKVLPRKDQTSGRPFQTSSVKTQIVNQNFTAVEMDDVLSDDTDFESCQNYLTGLNPAPSTSQSSPMMPAKRHDYGWIQSEKMLQFQLQSNNMTIS